MSQNRKRFFCFGYGYTADYLGHALQQQGGWTLGGTTRDDERRNELLARRIRARIFDYQHPIADPQTLFGRFSHILISTPPDYEGDPVFNMHAEDLINLPNLKWIGYLSSTGVYGNRDGLPVDESSSLNPTSKRGTRRAIAEEQYMMLHERYNVPVHIFRLSGIYGPGRSALDSVRAGIARRIDKPGHMFNRIHVDDIVQVLLASMANPNPGSIYNLADDLPAPSHEVIEQACNMLGFPVPDLVPFEDIDMAPIARSFYSDNKHVLNNKIKSELGVQLKYPDYKEGLKGCLQAEENHHQQQQKIIA
ncbi:MAG: SDR family oxidoreductase [Pseudomonadota bacterium]